MTSVTINISDYLDCVPTELLKRELESRHQDELTHIMMRFFDEIRGALNGGRIDDVHLLLDRIQFPKWRDRDHCLSDFTQEAHQ